MAQRQQNADRPQRRRPTRQGTRPQPKVQTKASARKAPTPASASRPNTIPQPKTKRPRLTPAQRARQEKLSRARQLGVVLTAVILACCAIVGVLLFARPSVSTVEKRNLATFPSLSWDSFWDGSFFSGVALWYSDTYPVREQLVSANQAIEGLHGVKTSTQMVGGVKQADELPPVEASTSGASASTSGTPKEEDRTPVEVPAQEEMAAAIQDQITNGLYVKGDTAYNIYYFSQEAVQEYADAINATASALEGQAEVYSLVAPNASAIMLSDEEVKELGGTNQVDAIKYFYSLYSEDVHTVDSVSKLQDHTDEYIFFRTDHHWTALGAYYGYEAFCETKGITPENRDDLEYLDLGDFLGSFYGELNSVEMENHPDTVDAWIPNGTNTLTLYNTDGSTEECNVITDTRDWGILSKTMAFIMGDQPLEQISNPSLSDGSSCFVIKDSFGDFFVPWLVDHYQTVWVADFRYFEGNIVDFVNEHDIKDVIIESNVTLAGAGVFGPAIMGRL